MTSRKRMTQEDFNHAVAIAEYTKQEYLPLMENNNPKVIMQDFMELTPAERVNKLNILLRTSDFSISVWKALKLIAHELREREDDISTKLMYWYIDVESKKLKFPGKKNGQRDLWRNVAIEKTMHILVDVEGFCVSSNRKKRKREKNEKTANGQYYSLSAAGATAKVFHTCEDNVDKLFKRPSKCGSHPHKCIFNLYGNKK